MDEQAETRRFGWEKECSAIVACRKCPRLVEWRESVAREKRRQFMEWDYWGKAVPHFGDPEADRLIVGLAPAAHGANRTGRMFTGDRSGDWLFRALHKAGVANQPESASKDDGLVLKGVAITAICHCAPPGNTPLPSELMNCKPYLDAILFSRKWEANLCLGSLAWNALFAALEVRPVPKFGHEAVSTLENGTKIIGCYHPSQQNTFTGRLTEEMLDRAIGKFLD